MASAGTPVEPVRLSYRAAPGCPGRDALLERLRWRAPALREVGGDTEAREFELVLTELSSHSWRGTLLLRTASGSPARRVILASTCAEALDLLTIIIAVAIDPRAARLGPAPFAPRSRRWRLSAGIGLGALFGLTPEVMPAVAAHVEVGFDRPPWLRPAARLVAARAQGPGHETAAGTAAFAWTAAALQACPLTLGRRFSVTGCLSLEIGVLEGHGSRVATPEAASLLWLAPGGVVRSAVALTRRLVLEVQGALSFPLERATFYFDRPMLDLHTVSRIVGSVGLALGMQFF